MGKNASKPRAAPTVFRVHDTASPPEFTSGYTFGNPAPGTAAGAYTRPLFSST
jgi:hypothetical protein